jgi:endonuclease/exonuclease/phosphatase family metal-dependent hydrolase
LPEGSALNGTARRDRLAFITSAAVFLFLAEALRAYLAVLFAGFYDGLFPSLRPFVLLIGLAPTLAIFPPALPLLRWVRRDRLIVYAAVCAAILRVGLCLPALPLRSVFSAAVVVCCAVFLLAATGSFSRRILAAGAVTGLVVDQVLRLFGRSYDLTLRPQWLPAQLAVSAVVIMLAMAYLAVQRRLDDADAEDRLERRSGRLRLRGAIGLASILFLDGTVLGMPEVAARLTGVPYNQLGLLLVLAGAAAVVVILASRGPIGRHRPAVVVLAAAVITGALAPFGLDGWPAALLVAAGHFSLLVLMYRALTPAGGRRGDWVMAVGLATLIGFQLAYGLTFFYGFTISAFRDRAPLIMGMVSGILALAMVLTPRPNASPARRVHWLTYALAGFVVLALALRLNWRAAPVPVQTSAARTLRVATFNVHYGFDGAWRYDPEAIARAIEAMGADVITLQEVAAGMPAAYGTDLALWLGRRLRMQSVFFPTINGLLGEAFLTRLPVVASGATLLPPDTADRKQLAWLTVHTGRSNVTVFGLHLGVREPERRVQMAAAIRSLSQTAPAALAGDLNDQPGSETLNGLQAAGFLNVFDILGVVQPPTAPALRPTMSIDHVLVRGMNVDAAHVVAVTASDHRPVVAILRWQ